MASPGKDRRYLCSVEGSRRDSPGLVLQSHLRNAPLSELAPHPSTLADGPHLGRKVLPFHDGKYREGCFSFLSADPRGSLAAGDGDRKLPCRSDPYCPPARRKSASSSRGALPFAPHRDPSSTNVGIASALLYNPLSPFILAPAQNFHPVEPLCRPNMRGPPACVSTAFAVSAAGDNLGSVIGHAQRRRRASPLMHWFLDNYAREPSSAALHPGGIPAFPRTEYKHVSASLLRRHCGLAPFSPQRASTTSHCAPSQSRQVSLEPTWTLTLIAPTRDSGRRSSPVCLRYTVCLPAFDNHELASIFPSGPTSTNIVH